MKPDQENRTEYEDDNDSPNSTHLNFSINIEDPIKIRSKKISGILRLLYIFIYSVQYLMLFVYKYLTTILCVLVEKEKRSGIHCRLHRLEYKMKIILSKTTKICILQTFGNVRRLFTTIFKCLLFYLKKIRPQKIKLFVIVVDMIFDGE